jgi:hypothetical protein
MYAGLRSALQSAGLLRTGATDGEFSAADILLV